MIRILAIGDLVGKAGRRCLQEMLPAIREKYEPDLAVANGENAAGGFGLTKKVFLQITEKFGIDCLTMGNHWQDKREILEFYPDYDNLLLPANMYNVKSMDLGYSILRSKAGAPFAVINLYGRAFMKGENSCPFDAVDEILAKIPDSIKTIIVDVHGEVTSEKQALGHYLSGKVSVVYGTHTHCPTADERILGGHTGFITDLGMTGAYDSVIGMRKEGSIRRLRTGDRKGFEPATGDPWICFGLFDVDPTTGRCEKVERHVWKLSDHQKQN